MPAFSYRTIQKPVKGSYKEKGSKFLAFAFPVASEVEIKENLEALRKEYFDARHHCFSWMLGPEKKHFRVSDDGEPNHSAGDPILGQIRSNDLTNVLIVVVRYFGGVKLGVGGLISAYKSAAEDALKNALIIEEEVKEKISITYDYVSTPEVMRLVKDFDLSILDQSFNEACSITFEVALKNKEDLLEKITLLQVTGTNLTLM
ncbi:MAG TPA: YigZ family protein [Chryseolinea sp.]|nr:YigZ family protein [Chryseolinea sp.]HPH45977.1 YigZ family protein [Chryseolinea sp.]HPM29810.1 YigZ family protein [Chryseolinea sp.]